MLEAIRNLGILKMIDEFEEFKKDQEFSPLDSIESFLKARKESIDSGSYAKLQFEPVNYETIGELRTTLSSSVSIGKRPLLCLNLTL